MKSLPEKKEAEMVTLPAEASTEGKKRKGPVSHMRKASTEAEKRSRQLRSKARRLKVPLKEYLRRTKDSALTQAYVASKAQAHTNPKKRKKEISK